MTNANAFFARTFDSTLNERLRDGTVLRIAALTLAFRQWFHGSVSDPKRLQVAMPVWPCTASVTVDDGQAVRF